MTRLASHGLLDSRDLKVPKVF
jgi:hypothetical protein